MTNLDLHFDLDVLSEDADVYGIDGMIFDALGPEEYAMVVEAIVTRNRRVIVIMNDGCVRCLNFNKYLDVTEIIVL